MESMNESSHERVNSGETLLMYGGVALIVLGLGMVMSTPQARKFAGLMGVGGLLRAALPDVQRYLKLKSM